MLARKVFLTGGTGSLGRALLERIRNDGWPWEVTIYSRDEVKQGELRARFPEHRFVLGDVRDVDWMALSMRGHDTVIHAAAYKQIPSSEVNAGEAIKTNVVGSMNVMMAAITSNVRQVVGISTDKACAPINLYGASKSAMEKLFQQGCSFGSTSFHLTRYGNVLGSRGSVVPFFRQQAARGGPLTITDPTMTRFWLTLRDATDLVFESLEYCPPGIILVPRARASSMAVLAQAVAPGIPTIVIGRMPGEKIHEQMVHTGESMHADACGGSRFWIWPAQSRHKGNLPDLFEFRSDTAEQLSVDELRVMLESDVGAP